MEAQAISSEEKNSYQLLCNILLPLAKCPGIGLIFFPNYAGFRIRIRSLLLPKLCQPSLIKEACKLLQIKKNLHEQKAFISEQEQLINQLFYYFKNKSVSMYKLMVLGIVLGVLFGLISALFVSMTVLSVSTIIISSVTTMIITVAVGVLAGFLIGKCINLIQTHLKRSVLNSRM